MTDALPCSSQEQFLQRSLLSGGSVAQTAEVYVEFSGGDKRDSPRLQPTEFGIVPERVRMADPNKRMPKFKIDVSAIWRQGQFTQPMFYKIRKEAKRLLVCIL